MSDWSISTAKKRQHSDSKFSVNLFQSSGFGLQKKSKESSPTSKSELWESYQQAKHLNQKGANISPVSILPIQAKLTVGEPGDKYEQEADNMAEQVMRMPEPTLVKNNVAMRSIDTISRKCAACEQDDKDLMRKESEPGQIEEDASDQVNRAVQSSGQPLDDATRSFMEPRFGQDFSQVRIHSDAQAAESATSINAHAYTHGNNVVFADGQYAPATNTGKQLLAHELTHVVQQMGGVQTKRIEAIPSSLSIHREEKPNSAMSTLAETAELPPSSPYAGMDSGLLEKLKSSYLKHVLGGTWMYKNPPNSFEETLNNMGAPRIAAITQVYQRVNSTGIWNFIDSIRHAWITSSRGFVFDCTNVGGLIAALDSSAIFCKDTIVGESMHSGSSCWREMISGTPGLHVCIGAETSIHVDMHQTVTGKGMGVNLAGLSPWSDEKIGMTVCQYAASAVWNHWADLMSGDEKTIFQKVEDQKDRIKELKGKVNNLDPKNNESDSKLTKADPVKLNLALNKAELTHGSLMPRFRALASQGLQGELDANANESLMSDFRIIETTLASVEAILHPPTESISPDFEAGSHWI